MAPLLSFFPLLFRLVSFLPLDKILEGDILLNKEREILTHPGLTQAEKDGFLLFLDEQIAKGFVDKEFIPYLESINSLSDFCTTQSCAGHRKRGFLRDHRWGELRLRLSQRAMNALKTYLTLFYQHPNIFYIEKRYNPGRKWWFGDSDGIYEEIIIKFSGISRSRSHFEDSIEFIVNVLEMMQRELDLKEWPKSPDLMRKKGVI